MVSRELFQSKIFVVSLIFSFILLTALETAPRDAVVDSDEDFKPVVRVKEAGEEIPAPQKERFERLMAEGKKFLQEDLDYERAIEKFKEAQAFAVKRDQRAGVFFYLSLAYYATMDEWGEETFNKTIRKLIEIDYYRALDTFLCPQKYIELFSKIKEEYGALNVRSKPAGADVYVNESKEPVGRTPLTIGAKAGSVKVRVKKGKKEKKDTLMVVAGRETISPIYIVKRRSGLIYVLGGLVFVGGVVAVLVLAKRSKTGAIVVNSTPTGATVFLDGNDTGKVTNCTLDDVSVGERIVKLVKEGYEDYERNVFIIAGEIHQLNINLERQYEFVTKWGSKGSGDGQFNEPSGIAIDNSDYIYVIDKYNNRIQKFTSDGTFVTKWGSAGSGDGQFFDSCDITVDSSGYIYVADSGNNRVQKFTSDGTFVTKWGSAGSEDGQFFVPRGIATDNSGHVYVVDTNNNRIQKFTSNGTFVTKWGEALHNPWGIAVDSSGYIYVVDSGNFCVKKFTSDGALVIKWGSYGDGNGQFSWFWGIAADSSGYIYVTDAGNNRIQKFTSDGAFVIKWGSEGSGNGQFINPYGIVVDSSGYVYVVDRNNHRIQKFGSVSVIQKISQSTYSHSNSYSFLKKLNHKPGLLNPRGLPRFKKKQDSKKIRR